MAQLRAYRKDPGPYLIQRLHRHRYICAMGADATMLAHANR